MPQIFFNFLPPCLKDSKLISSTNMHYSLFGRPQAWGQESQAFLSLYASGRLIHTNSSPTDGSTGGREVVHEGWFKENPGQCLARCGPWTSRSTLPGSQLRCIFSGPAPEPSASAGQLACEYPPPTVHDRALPLSVLGTKRAQLRGGGIEKGQKIAFTPIPPSRGN